MRYLIVLLLAATASASLIVTGTNLQYADAVGFVTDQGPLVAISLQAGHGPVLASVTLTSYITIEGATGEGTAMHASMFIGCDANPFAIIGICDTQLWAPTNFTFGVPTQITEMLRMSIGDFPWGDAEGEISPPMFFNVFDAAGNLVHATFTYSEDAPASPAAVSNPEPGTLGLALVAAFAFAGRRGLSALRQPRPSRA